VDVERTSQHEYTGSVVGIDLGLKEFYTDSQGGTIENPRYFRKTEKKIKRTHAELSKLHFVPLTWVIPFGGSVIPQA
jgi:putative transposase